MTDISVPAEILASIVGVGGAGLLASLAQLGKLAERMSKLEGKFEMIVNASVEHAKREFVMKDVGEINSPTILFRRTKDQFDKTGLTPRIKAWWEAKGQHIRSENELFLAMRAEFMYELSDLVCKPLGLIQDSCVIAAIGIAREAQVKTDPSPKMLS